MSSANQERQVDRKGKGKAKDQGEDQSGEGRPTEGENGENEDGQDQPKKGGDEGQQQMKEVRRPPPLPAVKGTIGAIESPSRRSFFSGSPTSTLRGNHSRGPSHDVSHHNRMSDSPSPSPSPYPGGQRQQSQNQGDDFQTRERPVFRSDPTLNTCFDRLRLSKKDEIRSLFGA